MASQEWTAGADLDDLEEVARRASRANFFRLVALLERMSSGAQRIGGDGPPEAEAIRLRHDPSMAFPSSDVSSCVIRNREQLLRALAEERALPLARFDVTSTFLGLSGSASPLPLYLSAEVAHEELSGGLRRPFLDVFHHRLLSLFYRGWARYSPALEATRDASDPWSVRLQALAGLDAASGRVGALSAGERLGLLPILAGRARTALGLSQVLQRILRAKLPKVEVAVEQFTGGTVSIDPRLRMRLGWATAELGRTSVLGEKVSDPGNSFRLYLRHVPESMGAELLPRGRLHRRIAAVVEEFVREPLEYDLCLQFDGGGGLGFALSSTAGQPLGARTFLRGEQARRELVVPGSQPR